MKNTKKVLFAGLLLGTIAQTALPMDGPGDGDKPKKSSFWQYIDNAKASVNKSLHRAMDYVNENTPVKITTIEPKAIQPDIETFLRNEMMKKSSLSKQDITDLTFKGLCDDEGFDSMSTDWSFNQAVTFCLFTKQKPVYRIKVPNIEDLFKEVETEDGSRQYIAIPDTQLSYRLKRKKTVLHGFLKHEEGKIFQYENDLITDFHPFQTTVAICLLGLRAKRAALLYCGLQSAQWGLGYRNELRADTYAINHIDDPAKLKEMSRHFERSMPSEGELVLQLPPRPSYKSRAKRFLEAAEKLEKKAEDHT